MAPMYRPLSAINDQDLRAWLFKYRAAAECARNMKRGMNDSARDRLDRKIAYFDTEICAINAEIQRRAGEQ